MTDAPTTFPREGRPSHEYEVIAVRCEQAYELLMSTVRALAPRFMHGYTDSDTIPDLPHDAPVAELRKAIDGLEAARTILDACCSKCTCPDERCGFCCERSQTNFRFERAINPIHWLLERHAKNVALGGTTQSRAASTKEWLHTVVNRDVTDDGARILLHRMINAFDDHRLDP